MITRPGEGAAAGQGSLRASHADREHAIDTLKTAFADGKLDKNELDDRLGKTLAAKTHADLAAVTADILGDPAQAAPPPGAARPPVSKEAVKWGLVAAGAVIPPALFVTAAYSAWPLALLAFPLLVIEMVVMIVFVTVTLTSQRKERSPSSRSQLPPQPGQPGCGAESQQHGSADHRPSPHRTLTEQHRGGEAVPASRRVPAHAGRGLSRHRLALDVPGGVVVLTEPDRATPGSGRLSRSRVTLLSHFGNYGLFSWPVLASRCGSVTPCGPASPAQRLLIRPKRLIRQVICS